MWTCRAKVALVGEFQEIGLAQLNVKTNPCWAEPSSVGSQSPVWQWVGVWALRG